MRLSRDLSLSVVLFAALISLAVFLGTRNTRPQSPARLPDYSTHSAEDSGTAALLLWLEAMGYRTQRIEGSSFDLPTEAKVLYIFPCGTIAGCASPNEREAGAITAWTERGNTLIVAADIQFGQSALGKALKLDTQGNYTMPQLPFSGLDQPLNGDLAPGGIALEAGTELEMKRADYVPYISSGNTNLPLLVSFHLGKGQVWLTSAPRLFINQNLRNESNASVVGAMLSDVPHGSIVAFDEYHITAGAASNNQTRQEDTGLSGLLWNTPAGWAFLYALVVVFAFLLLNGQRLGRAVPVAQALVRRRPAEYIVAMAHLTRRAHKREMVLSHYHAGLKRRLAKPYGISPDLPDEEFVATLAGLSHVDTTALLQTLHALSQKRIGEQDLVKLVHQAVQFHERQG